MVRLRKTPRNQTAKRHSLLLSILAGLGHLLRLFAGWIFRHARKNPLMACGFFLFVVGFCFVTFNALFYQSASHRTVFIQTRPLVNQNTNATIQNAPEKAVQSSNTTPDAIVASSSIQSNIAPNADKTLPDNNPENLLDIQKKLAAMGLYDGPLDGLDGPKTRNAIALWRQNSKPVSGQGESQKQHDDIASLISGALSKNDNVDHVTTQSLSDPKTSVPSAPKANDVVTGMTIPQTDASNGEEKHDSVANNFKPNTADVMRVQAGLRAFGDDHVVVTGTEDENTAEALRNFQKMFSLTVTGKINQEVIDKMKDIGLIG